MFNIAQGTTTLLAIRFQQRFPASCTFAPDFGIKYNRTPLLLINDQDIGEYLTSHNVELPAETIMNASPLSPPTAISIFTSSFADNPAYLNWAIRSLSSFPSDVLYFYVPQLVQALHHDKKGFIEGTVMDIAKVSALFAHQVIWNMKANLFVDDAATIASLLKPKLDSMIALIEQHFSEEQQEFYEREFRFFHQVTSISGTLKAHSRKEKTWKKQIIDQELSKITVDPGVYLPSNPESIVVGIDYGSGRPLQSAAKTPFMATFLVRGDREEDVEGSESVRQAAIFKVGDDCRQDALALQLIATFKQIFATVGLDLYLFPYRVVATAAGCGIIEVIPDSISRDQLGREQINNLYE